MYEIRQFFGNKGEWSELYAAASLLSNAGAFAADASQSAIENEFYEVLKVYLPTRGDEFDLYQIDGDDVRIQHFDGREGTIQRSEIEALLPSVFEQIKDESNPPTFTIESGNRLIALLERESMSASSAQQASDMDLQLKDPETEVIRPKVGFSVKSQVGSPSTLLNASGATNFTYRIVNSNSTMSLDPLGLVLESDSVISILGKLAQAGYSLEFESMDNQVFKENLELVDALMVENVAKLLHTYYMSSKSTLSEVVPEAFPESDAQSRQKIFKIKQMLGVVAMGMRPSTSWDGDVTKFRGMLVVTPKGEVNVYYLNNLRDFEEFLFRSVKFERGARGRHKYGVVYEVNGEHFIKLNLQIRFVK